MRSESKLNRLKVVLAENDRTNRWLAEKMGKSEMTISRWATNAAQPSVAQLFEIAKILNIDPRSLIFDPRSLINEGNRNSLP